METKRLKRLPVGIPYLSTSMTPRCDYIERLANANKWTNEETVRQLAKQYDGYHFTWPSPDIFNPSAFSMPLQEIALIIIGSHRAL